CRRIQSEKIEVPGAGLPRRLRRGGDVGPEAAELLEEAAGLEKEHAAVPEEPAARDVAARGLQVRLFHEALHLEADLVLRDRLAALDVAVARVRSPGADPERDQRPFRRERQRGSDGGVE